MRRICAIAAILWLGGWHTGLLPFDPADKFEQWMGTFGWVLGNLINVPVFIVKGWGGVFVMMWIRWTLPRFRVDQMMNLCWKYFIPISFANFIGVLLWAWAINEVHILDLAAPVRKDPLGGRHGLADPSVRLERIVGAAGSASLGRGGGHSLRICHDPARPLRWRTSRGRKGR